MCDDKIEASIGILAYGSLIEDPGPEIGPYIDRTVSGVQTPFSVEYARSSRSRGGGPTLVPIDEGGAKVAAVIHILKKGVSVEQAMDWVWRREVRKYGLEDHYIPRTHAGKNSVVVETLLNFHGVKTVLYTRIAANISPLTASELARLAIESAQNMTAQAGKDGISYLLNARRQGIRTPLTEFYEQEILRVTKAADLSAALSQVRKAPV